MKNTWNAKAKARSKKRLEYFKERIRKIRIIEGAQMGIGINPNIVEQIKEERTLSCERCLKPHLNRPYKGLLIHHKDGNKLNNDLDNLQLDRKSVV